MSYLKRIVFGTIILLCVIPVTADSQEPKPIQNRVDSVILRTINHDSPGVMVIVINDGEVVINKGYGLAMIENEIPVTSETAFNIGSVAKQFTAMAITILEKQGKLSVDDDIHKYLPDMPCYDKPVTINHLLHQTSGIRDDLYLWVLSGRYFGDVVDQEEMYSLIRRQENLVFPTGSQYGYSDSNYTLLALILSRITGQSFGEWVTLNILNPLDMTATVVVEDYTMLIKNRASCYSYESGEFRYLPLNNSYPGPSNIYSTGEDMAKWVKNFETDQVGGGVMKAMTEQGVLDNGETISYARGLGLGVYNGNRIIRHGGTEGGFNSEVAYFPDNHLAIVILSNYNSDPTGLCRTIAELFLPGSKGMEKETKAEKINLQTNGKSKKVKLSKEQVEAVSGTFWYSDTWNIRTVYSEGDKIYYKRSPDNKTEIRPISENEFILDGTNIILRFNNLKDKHFCDLSFDADGQTPTHAKRVEIVPPTVERLREYEGIYYSKELDAIHHMDLRGEGLFNLKMKWQRDVPLKAVITDRFTFLEGSGRIIFIRDGEGNVTGYILNAPRVGDIEFNKLSL